METAVLSRFVERIRPAFQEGDSNALSKSIEQTNVTMLENQYMALLRGDYVAFLDTLDDNVEMEIIGPAEVPFAGKWKGKPTVAEAIRSNFARIDQQKPELLSLIAQGDMVVITGRETGRIVATGKPYDIHWVQHFTIRNGKVTRFWEMFDSGPMVEAMRPEK